MSDGISPNNLNDLSKVYLDQISTFREMRKQETQKDIERWSQGADPTATQREGYEEKKRGEVLTALKKRPLDKKTKEKIAADIVKKKGDTSKSDDRYAYEEVQVEAKVDTGSAEAKASARNKRNTPAGKDYKFDTSVFITRKPGESLDSARTRKRRDAHAAKRGVKEDKAFDNVVSALRKKHGESGVLTKDSPKPKVDKAKIAAERKKRQEADNKAFASRAKKAGYKNPQDYANVVARYGSEDNYKKGKGLGT